MSLTKAGKIIIGLIVTAFISATIYIQTVFNHEIQILKQEAKVKTVITKMVTPTVSASPSATLTPKKEASKDAEVVPTKVIPTKGK